MVRLIDRFTGQVLGTIPQTDLDALQSVLVSETEDDADYYLTLDVLEVLQTQGLSPQSLTLLREVLTQRGDLDLGWEPLLENPAYRLSGNCRSEFGPLPGLRAELSVDDMGEEVARAFSRPDGSFEIALSADDATQVGDLPLILTLMALGDSPLVDVEVGPLGKSPVRDLGEVELPVLRGRLVSSADSTPLIGLVVDAILVDYSCEPQLEHATWTVTDSEGRFVIPYPPVESQNPTASRLELEMTAPSGQPLETLLLLGPLAHNNLGDHAIEAPNGEWQPSQEARDSVEHPEQESVIPGVSRHPLE